MKTILVILSLIFGFSCFSQSQTEMNITAGNEYKKADDELNKIYLQILTEYKLDTTFIDNLKTSQNIWIKFRDAELEMKFPSRERGYYGSIHSTCTAYYLRDLTEKRTETLRLWLNGFIERDACNGSIKRK